MSITCFSPHAPKDTLLRLLGSLAEDVERADAAAFAVLEMAAEHPELLAADAGLRALIAAIGAAPTVSGTATLIAGYFGE